MVIVLNRSFGEVPMIKWLWRRLFGRKGGPTRFQVIVAANIADTTNHRPHRLRGRKSRKF